MQKLNFFLILLLFLNLNIARASSAHTSNLRVKFPYGLLGDDYGILLENDLAINVCGIKSEPFPPKELISPYQYWQCFEKKNISLVCSSSGRAEPHEGIMGLIHVKASNNHITHDYMESRSWPIRECQNTLKDYEKIMKAQRNVCISGSFIETEVDQRGHKTMSWLFERIKTKIGCEGRGCIFTDEIKKDLCPDLRHKSSNS